MGHIDTFLTPLLSGCRLPLSGDTLQIILDLCIPKKELAKTCSQILFIQFQKSFMAFCQELRNPKRNYENQIWTLAPKDVIMKK